jgi:hypothetical protein
MTSHRAKEGCGLDELETNWQARFPSLGRVGAPGRSGRLPRWPPIAQLDRMWVTMLSGVSPHHFSVPFWELAFCTLQIADFTPYRPLSNCSVPLVAFFRLKIESPRLQRHVHRVHLLLSELTKCQKLYVAGETGGCDGFL